MAISKLMINVSEAEQLTNAMAQYEGNVGPVIDDTLKQFGAKEIENRIRPLIHGSGRDWAGKPLSATAVNPFRRVYSPLTVEIHSKTTYNYLYFPDDGTNTRRHIGNQQFMMRGAEAATEPIIDMCISRLIQKIGE